MSSRYSIKSSTLTSIANAIRTKKGTSNSITPANMPSEILSINGGGITLTQINPFSSPVSLVDTTTATIITQNIDSSGTLNLGIGESHQSGSSSGLNIELNNLSGDYNSYQYLLFFRMGFDHAQFQDSTYLGAQVDSYSVSDFSSGCLRNNISPYSLETMCIPFQAAFPSYPVYFSVNLTDMYPGYNGFSIGDIKVFKISENIF